MNICPTHIGAKDWEPSAFSPRTGLIYADIFNICMDLTDHKVAYIPGTPYDGMDLQTHSGGNSKKWGEFIAWNPVSGQKVWSIPEDFMTMSGVLATGGDVVFYGTTDGWFRAVDARVGQGAVVAEAEFRDHLPADRLPRAGRAGIHRGGRRRRRRRQPGDGPQERLPASRRHALRLLDRRRVADERCRA